MQSLSLRGVSEDFQIGDRLIQPRINSIQYRGNVLHLEPKVMQVLLVLASKPGEVFTREEIRQVVWRDVFVGDDVLMRAISEICRAFEDNPQTPHTIQTVPKVGYRLIATVSADPPAAIVAPAASSASLFDGGEAKVAIAVQGSSKRVRSPVRDMRLGVLAAIAVVLLVIAGSAVWLRAGHASASAAAFVSHPLTTYSGSQLQPALSPGGDAVAFVSNRNENEGHHLYVKSLKSGAPVRVTSGEDQDYSPAWSPDGLSLALVRQSSSGSTYWNGDSMPSVSPDGKLLAFARGSEQSARDIFVMDLSRGTTRQLTADAHLILGLVWSADASNAMRRRMDSCKGAHVQPSKRSFTDATIFASGAAHIELGDGDRMLSSEYFPADTRLQISPGLHESLRSYYDSSPPTRCTCEIERHRPRYQSASRGIPSTASVFRILSGPSRGNTMTRR